VNNIAKNVLGKNFNTYGQSLEKNFLEKTSEMCKAMVGDLKHKISDASTDRFSE